MGDELAREAKHSGLLAFETGTDEALVHGLIPGRDTRKRFARQTALYKLNMLFFDSLTVRSTDYLVNRNTYEWWGLNTPCGWPDALFVGRDGLPPAIRIWMDHRNESLEHVAEIMLRYNVGRHGMAESELLEHARLVDKQNPGFLRGSYNNQNKIFADSLEAVIKEINRSGLPANRAPCRRAIKAGSLDLIRRRIKRRRAEGKFSNTWLWNYITSTRRNLDNQQLRQMKCISHAAQQYAFAREIGDGALLGQQGQLDYIIDLLQSSGGQASGQISLEDAEVRKFPISVPLAISGELPFEDILALRRESVFLEARHYLRRLRGEGDDAEIDVYEKCLPGVLEECGKALKSKCAGRGIGLRFRGQRVFVGICRVGKCILYAAIKVLVDDKAPPGQVDLVFGTASELLDQSLDRYDATLRQRQHRMTGRCLYSPVDGTIPLESEPGN